MTGLEQGDAPQPSFQVYILDPTLCKHNKSTWLIITQLTRKSCCMGLIRRCIRETGKVLVRLRQPITWTKWFIIFFISSETVSLYSDCILCQRDYELYITLTLCTRHVVDTWFQICVIFMTSEPIPGKMNRKQKKEGE